MGILYNRSNRKFSFLPYSDYSKIITYLTLDNFKGSSSTIWGDDYPVPMRRIGGYWELSSDGKSVYVHNTEEAAISAIIHPSSPLQNFTLYIVGQYYRDTPYSGLTVRSGNTVQSRPAYIFEDSPSTAQKEIGSAFSSWESNNNSYFDVDTSIFETFHAYAVSHPIGSKPAHVLDNMGVEYFPTDGEVTAETISWEASSAGSGILDGIYIKFLAIVSEAESATVMQNNISYLRAQFNLT